MALSVQNVSKIFALSPNDSAKLRQATPDVKRRAEAYYKSALAAPGIVSTLKAQLIAELNGATIASVQPSTTAPAAPAAPKVTPPAPPVVKVPQWICVGGVVSAYVPGQPIAPGALVCYDGATWEQPSSTPAAPQVAPAAQGTVNLWVDAQTIPVSPAGKGRLPWVLAARWSPTTSCAWVDFGYERSTGAYSKNRCSVRLDELLASLEPTNVDAMRRQLLALKSQLG